ncbi:MAG: hypothetical protein K2X55_27815 [Burkholderiaceae bacterium]|nr:hypothetical protein [Burkholderiaceae bacterium]
MNSEVKTFKDACALTAHVWRASAGFFKSIEVWLLVLVAMAMVAGVFFAFMLDVRAVLAFSFVLAYFVVRPVLHARGILKWPFL